MSQAARLIDPYTREARTMTDVLLAKIPFASMTLHPKIDIWGNKILNRNWEGLYNERVENDPVDRALTKLGVYPSILEGKIRNVDLTDAQYETYATLGGRMRKQRLTGIVSTPGFDQLSEVSQVAMVRTALEAAEKQAQTMVLAEYPE
jgi:hypothetical protein